MFASLEQFRSSLEGLHEGNAIKISIFGGMYHFLMVSLLHLFPIGKLYCFVLFNLFIMNSREF